MYDKKSFPRFTKKAFLFIYYISISYRNLVFIKKCIKFVKLLIYIMEEKYNFEFTVVELNTIFKGLQKMPYEVSAELIHKIQISVQTTQQEREKAAKLKK